MKLPIEIENRRIGELLAEITGKGWVELVIDVFQHPNGSRIATVDAARKGDTDTVTVTAETMLEALSLVVDIIRTQRGEPTLEQENAAALERDEASAGQLVEIGPEACCVQCGSKAGIVFSRRVSLVQPWDGGLPLVFGVEGAEGFLIRALPGEIGACPDCGKRYQLAGS